MKVVLAYLEEDDILSIYVDGKLRVGNIENLFGYDPAHTERMLSAMKRKGIMEYEEVTIPDLHKPPSELPGKLVNQK